MTAPIIRVGEEQLPYPVEQAGGGGSQPVGVAVVTVSSPELLALHDTPKVIVPAPGAGKVALPVGFGNLGPTPLFTLINTVTPYVASGNLYLGPIADAVDYPYLTVDATRLEATSAARFIQYAVGAFASLDGDASTWDSGSGIGIALAADSNPTGGDGKLVVICPYVVASYLG